MNFELWSEGLGIIPIGKKKKIKPKLTKEEELAKSQATLDFVLNAFGNDGGSEQVSLKTKPRITRQ